MPPSNSITALIAIVAFCAQPGLAATATGAAPRAPLEPLPNACRGAITSRACRCAIDPSLAECAPCEPGSSGELTRRAERQIVDGQWDAARGSLYCALEQTPVDTAAEGLLEQLLSEPFGYFASRFGPGIHRYLTRPGDTVGSIAARCLKDASYFVALARLNQLRVPAELGADTELAIPGAKICDAAGTDASLEAPAGGRSP